MKRCVLATALFTLSLTTVAQTAKQTAKVEKADLEERIDRLIHELGSKDFAERERAATAIVAIGESALGKLKTASKSPDPEVARRAKTCIDAIERMRPVAVPVGVTVIRLPNEEFKLE